MDINSLSFSKKGQKNRNDMKIHQEDRTRKCKILDKSVFLKKKILIFFNFFSWLISKSKKYYGNIRQESLPAKVSRYNDRSQNIDFCHYTCPDKMFPVFYWAERRWYPEVSRRKLNPLLEKKIENRILPGGFKNFRQCFQLANNAVKDSKAYVVIHQRGNTATCSRWFHTNLGTLYLVLDWVKNCRYYVSQWELGATRDDPNKVLYWL